MQDSQKGFAHILGLLVLLAGLGVAVYLMGQKVNFFSKASNSPIVFKSIDGRPLPLNSQGIPQTTSPTVKVYLTSTLGPPVSVSGPISGPNTKGTVSFRMALTPTDFDRSAVRSYDKEPYVFSSTFPNNPGIQFLWVEFKDSTGKTDRRSAQIEIIGSANGFGKAIKFNNEKSNNAYAIIKPTNVTTWVPSEWTFEGWVKTPKAVSGNNSINSVRPYSLATYTKTPTTNDLGYLFNMSLTQYEGRGDSQPIFQALIANSPIKNNYMTVGSQSSIRLKADTWNHIAVTGVAAGNTCTLKLYVNGVLADSFQKTNPQCRFSLDQAQDILIAKPPVGVSGLDGRYWFPGAIDEVRFSSKLQYNSNFTPPTTPFLNEKDGGTVMALYHFDSNVNDSGWYHHNTQSFGNVKFIDSDISEAQPSPTTAVSPNARRVFITSSTYSGDLKSAGSKFGLGKAANGLDGADKVCQGSANIAKLGGTWKAWISDSKTSAAVRLTHVNVPYKLLNGVTVANNWRDLTDGNIQNPINVNEFKSLGSGTPWTNTNKYGQITSSNTSCNNWTSNNITNRVSNNMGNYLKTNGEWTAWNSATQCGTPQTLYCFEQ